MTDPDRLLELAQRVRLSLEEHSLSLATAESCTGGLLGHLLTEIPGISAHYRGGLISYSDELKRAELNVPEHTLLSHGAVSAQACVAMAAGARLRYGADVGLAITGIAGPDGGTPDKPVGLTYVALADQGGQEVRRFVWDGDRRQNKLSSAEAGMELLLERLGRS